MTCSEDPRLARSPTVWAETLEDLQLRRDEHVLSAPNRGPGIGLRCGGAGEPGADLWEGGVCVLADGSGRGGAVRQGVGNRE